MANPRKEHWKALKWILRYLHGTRDYGLVFGGQSEEFGEQSVKMCEDLDPLEGFVDANYVGDLDTRRSTTGYSFAYMMDRCLGDQPFIHSWPYLP